MTGRTVTDITVDTLETNVRTYSVNFVYLGPNNHPLELIFERAARHHQGRFGFLRAEKGKEKEKNNNKVQLLWERFGVTEQDGPTVVCVTKSDDAVVFNHRSKQPSSLPSDGEDTEWTESELMSFIEAHSFPLVTEMGPSNFEDLTQTGKLIVFAVVDSQPDQTGLASPFGQTFLLLAKQYRNRFLFATIDGTKYAKYVSQFGIEASHLPTVFIFEFSNEQFYIPDHIVLRSGFAITSFLDDVLAGKIQAKGTHAWYSPIRLYHRFEKWLGTFSETQLIVTIFVVMGLFAAILVMGCIYMSIDDGPRPTPATASSPPASASSPPVPASPVVPASSPSAPASARTPPGKKKPKKD